MQIMMNQTIQPHFVSFREYAVLITYMSCGAYIIRGLYNIADI